MYDTKKNKRLIKKNKTKKQKGHKVFFDDFTSLKGKIPKYTGKSVPTKFNEIRGNRDYVNDKNLKNELLNCHKGQRKLMLMELDFINHFWPEITKRKLEDNITFLYVGSAPGHHLTKIIELFSKWKFIFYDPRKHENKLRKYKNVKIFTKFFTDDDCKKYANQNNVLFISDIRNMEAPKKYFESKNIYEEEIFEDMRMQMEWVKIIKPIGSSLKFRLPYAPGNTKYLNGELKLQCWAPQQSTEGRLFVPHNFKMINYDNAVYDKRANYFNRVIRRSFFNHNNNCYQHNYDSVREYIILKNFVENVLNFKNESNIIIENKICGLMKQINNCVSVSKSKLPILPPHYDKIKHNL
jgi:hypothetical protein